jgi:hypothetical protein
MVFYIKQNKPFKQDLPQVLIDLCSEYRSPGIHPKTKKPPGLAGGLSEKIGSHFHRVGKRAGVTAIASEVAQDVGFSDIGSGYGRLLLTTRRCGGYTALPEKRVLNSKWLLVNLPGVRQTAVDYRRPAIDGTGKLSQLFGHLD